MAKSKKVTKKVSKSVVESVAPAPTPIMATRTTQTRMLISPKVLRVALIVVLAALATYKLGPWLFPVIVDNRPVSRLALYSKLEKAYGQATIDEIVNERILDAAIAKQNIKIDQTKISEQITSLEKQFESIGGLDEALKQRGLTRADLEKQIKTQLSVEEILKDKINPTEEEIKKEYDANKTALYKDKKFEDVKAEITTNLKDSKLREAFLAWFDEVKKEVSVKNFGL